MRNFTTLALALLLTACASTSEQGSTSSTTSPATAPQELSSNTAEKNADSDSVETENAEKERLVCRSEQTVGSNRKTRVCRKVSN